MVVKYINDHARVVAISGTQPVLALVHEGVVVREIIDRTVQFNPAYYFPIKALKGLFTLNEVAHEIAEQDLFIVTRQVCMREEIHTCKIGRASCRERV